MRFRLAVAPPKTKLYLFKGKLFSLSHFSQGTTEQQPFAPIGCVLALPSSCVMTHRISSPLPPVTSGSGSSHQHHSAQWEGVRGREVGRGTTGSGSAASSTTEQDQGEKRRTSRYLHLLIPPSTSPASSLSLYFFFSPCSPPRASDIMSSSLLENPVQAILYLRELTTIVQNQQSLIQTQRTRIEELDRRVDELIGENRHLRDVRVQQQHPYLHHHLHFPDPSCLHHHHPQEPQLKTSGGSLPDHHAAAPVQVEASPGVQPPPAQPLDPGDMQLVPADPSTISPVESESENGGSCPSCRSLVPLTPTTLCRSLTLARTSE